MGKHSLPEKWISGEQKTLNVRDDLGLNSPVTNLFVYKSPIRKSTGNPRTKKLLCKWMPFEEEDTRPDKGRTKSGKRIPLQGSTGMVDPYDAGREAIAWLKTQKTYLIELAKENEYNSNFSLRHYWEKYIKDFEKEYVNRRGGRKRCTNEKSNWNEPIFGIGHQKFADKSIDKINFADLNDYWELLDSKGKKIGSDMSKAKKAKVTVINKLFERARTDKDFPDLNNPQYPIIRTWEKQEAVYMDRNEFDELKYQISLLSGDNAQKEMTYEEFMDVPWNDRDRKNQRNFVELYDAVMVMWYFYLRAEDMPRLRNEWFSIGLDADGEEVVKLNMREAKGGRDTKTSFPYRPDALKAFKRILKRRKPNGYFLFDWYSRPTNNPNAGQVGETLNALLQFACTEAYIKKKVIWTSLRHTAFMETCRDYPQLSEVTELINFAENAYTSADMLRNNYLKKIDRTASAKRARNIIKEDSTANKTLQERAKDQLNEIKEGKREEELTDQKFLKMDKREGRTIQEWEEKKAS